MRTNIYRVCSCIYIIVHTDVLTKKSSSIEGRIEMARAHIAAVVLTLATLAATSCAAAYTCDPGAARKDCGKLGVKYIIGSVASC